MQDHCFQNCKGSSIDCRAALVKDNMFMTCVLPGIEVPGLVAEFIFERIHWTNEGEVEPFPLEPPEGWSLHDLSTLAFFVANKEHDLAKELIEGVTACSKSYLLPSATLLQGENANDNYLKKNPFKRRKSKKARKGNVDGHSGQNCGSEVVKVVGGEQNSKVSEPKTFSSSSEEPSQPGMIT